MNQLISLKEQQIDIFHNIMWSRYKAAVFSELHTIASKANIQFRFFQIAETETDRVGFSSIDKSAHQYPYQLMFAGAYEDIGVIRRCTAVAKAVFDSKSDLIILPGYHLVEHWMMLMVAKMQGKKVAVFCDSTSYDKKQTVIKTALKRFFFRHCDGYFAYGQRSMEYLAGLGAKADAIIQRCQAAAPVSSYDEAAVLSHRSKVRPEGMRLRISYVGRLSSEKNLDRLLEAFRIVLKTFDAELHIIGSGPLRSTLAESARDMTETGNVVFRGSMDPSALSYEYLETDFLILPSLREPWGLVVNEAFLFGCPALVSNNCGCVPELISEHKTGYIFDPSSAASISDCISKAVKSDRTSFEWAVDCINLIRHYSPQMAANQIFKGCQTILQQ